MKASEIRQMDDEQLQVALNDVKKDLFMLRVQSATERLETPSELKKKKKDLARIKTIMHERYLEMKKLEAETATEATDSASAGE